jgi:hypothetical protein
MATNKKIPLSSAQLAANQDIINADYQAQITQKVTYDAAVKKVSTLKDKLYNQNKYMQTTYNLYLALLYEYDVYEPVNHPKGHVDILTLSSSVQKQIQDAYTKWQAVVAEVKQTGNDLLAADKDVVTAQKTLNQDKAALAAAVKANASGKPAPAVGSSGAGNPPGGNPPSVIGDPKPYTYNAPMTSSSYLKFGPQVLSAKNDMLITDPGAWDHAQLAWQPDKDGKFKGAKGVIQMSQSLAADASVLTKGAAASGLATDTTPYGFKFLYNPTSVGMSWGIVESFSPQFEQSGQDIATAIGNGLLASTVTFSLILNRIEDMMYIKDSTGEFLTRNTSPYPHTVSSSERGLIYDRGTMYDLEYLFRATGGYNSQYKSSVGNIVTADKGWLMPIPVELHLGANLRYLVRVSSLDINHAIFNERMVPIFTTVNITCTRYYDNQVLYSAASTAAAGGR